MSELAIMEHVQKFATSGPAALMANGLSAAALRPAINDKRPVANALLRKDEWKELDRRVIEVARQRLTAVADLRAAGLVQRLGGLGTLLSEYEKMGDMSPASLDMAADTEGEKDTLTFNLVSVPVPIIHKDYMLNIRRLEASRRLGDGLDTTQAAVATRLVADAFENLLFNGNSMVVDGNSIYGYTTHPDRNTGSGSDFGTIANIYTTINSMVGEAEADYYFGPYTLYVSTVQYGQLRQIYTDGSGQSAMQRALSGIPQLTQIRPADSLADGEAVLVTMQPDVVDLALAVDITNVQWDTKGGMISNYKIMMCAVPRIKSDANSRSGIVHYTGI